MYIYSILFADDGLNEVKSYFKPVHVFLQDGGAPEAAVVANSPRMMERRRSVGDDPQDENDVEGEED